MEFSERKGIFSHTLVYSFGNFFSRGLNFILLPFYSHYIAPDEFGIYSVIISIITIASTILNLGLPGIFVKNLTDSQSIEAKRKFISNVISLVSLITIPLLIVILIFSGEISRVILGNSKYGLEIILGTLSILSLNYSYYLSVYYVAEENSRKYVLVNSISAIVNFVLNILLIVLFDLGINGIFIAQIFSSFVIIILASDVIKNYLKFEIDYAYLKPLLILSLPLLFSSVFTIVVELIDRFIVLKMLGETQAGIYSFGYRIALIYNLFVLSFKSAWIPHYFNLKIEDEKESSKHLGRVLTKLVFVSAVIILSVQISVEIFFDKKIFSLQLFDVAYSDGKDFIIYVMIGYFFSLMIAYYSIAPYKFNKTIHFLIADLVAMILNLLFNFLLIPEIGVKGAAISTMLAFFAGAFYLMIYNLNKIKIEYEYGKIALILFLFLLCFVFLMEFENILLALIVLTCVLVMGIKFNFVNKDFRSILKF
ncbi:MAG: oligosaccharide flippase family protein [Ignavibacteria bacterium]|nr:oligosaccharide flippase family protein [Ignavibacteria bacterium]